MWMFSFETIKSIHLDTKLTKWKLKLSSKKKISKQTKQIFCTWKKGVGKSKLRESSRVLSFHRRTRNQSAHALLFNYLKYFWTLSSELSCVNTHWQPWVCGSFFLIVKTSDLVATINKTETKKKFLFYLMFKKMMKIFILTLTLDEFSHDLISE